MANDVTIHVKSEDHTDMDLIGRKVEAKAKRSFGKVGAHSGAAFAAGFIKTITLGQVGSGFAMAATKMAPQMAHLGGALGVTLAAALAVKLAKSLSALLPLALGGGILAGPIIYLVKTQEKAIDRLKKKAKGFMDTISQPVKVPFLRSLEAIGDKLGEWGPKIRKAIGPLAKELPGFVKGALKGIENFAEQIGKKMPSITKGFRQWGKELPGIGKSLGKMLTAWIEDGPAVAEGVADTAKSMRDLAKAVGAVGRGFKGFNKINSGFLEMMEEQRRAVLKFRVGMLKALIAVADAWGLLSPTGKRVAKSLRESLKGAEKELDKTDKKLQKVADKKVVTKLKADKRDAQAKIADIDKRLQKTHDKKVISKLKADKKDAQNKINEINRRLDQLDGKTATTYIKTVYKGINKKNQGAPFHATGGIVGGLGTDHAAEGGPRGGRVWVGEQGPELVDLPMGSHVNSNPDSMAMTGKGSRGGINITINAPNYVGAPADLLRALTDAKRRGQLDVLFR